MSSRRAIHANAVSSSHLSVLADKLLAQLNVLLLGVGLRGAGVDDLLPTLALGLALYTVSALAQSLSYVSSNPVVGRMRSGASG